MQLTNLQLRDAAAPVNARGHLGTVLHLRMTHWVSERDRPPGSDPLAYERACDVVAVYDDALARLEGKTGARADAAREQIAAARAPFAAAVKLVDSLQVDFNGPLGIELQRRITSTRAGLAAALAAREGATRATIDAALVEVERCLADVRELDRDLDSILKGLSTSALTWPNIAELRSAGSSTRDLEKQSAKNPRAAQVHAAIEQGLKASAHVAVLWICYETQPDHELLKWRWRAFAERG